MKQKYKTLINYVKDWLEDYETDIDLAIANMEKYRCPLYEASNRVFYQLEDAIHDWCEDNNIDFATFDTYETFGKDYEDIFWDAIL